MQGEEGDQATRGGTCILIKPLEGGHSAEARAVTSQPVWLYVHATACQRQALGEPLTYGKWEAPERAPGHSQAIVAALRGTLNISWLSWVTGLVLTIWGARKPSGKRHKMTSWVSWADPHQIMRIRIRQKRFEILKVHIRLFRLRQQFSFVRRPEQGRFGA